MDTIDDKVGDVPFPRAVIPAEIKVLLTYITRNSGYRTELSEKKHTTLELNKSTQKVEPRVNMTSPCGTITCMDDLTSVEFTFPGSYDSLDDTYSFTGMQMCVPGSDFEDYTENQKRVMGKVKRLVSKYFAEREIKPKS